jgi:hypothetical protein
MGVRMVDGVLVSDDGTPADITESLTGSDAPSDAANANDGEYPTCAECGNVNYEYIPGSRGRKPKYHEACRPITPSRGRGGGGGTRATIRGEAALREALTARYVMLAGIAGLRHHAYKQAVLDKTERAVEADIAYAKQNPWFRKHLESFLEKSAAAEVITVHALMFAPVVMGEAATANRKRASRGSAKPGRTDPRRPEPGPTRQQPEPPKPETDEDIKPDNVTDLFGMPGEPEARQETVNAGAMPGMPG